MKVAAPLAYVRTIEGEVVQLNEGDSVPENALPEHVETLKAQGILEGSAAKVPGVRAILDDVGDDKEKAAAALQVEQAKATPRPTLITGLEAVLATQDEPDVITDGPGPE